MRPLKVSQSITNRDAASLSMYLLEVSRIPQITPEEEIVLTQLIRNGNKQAVAELAKANLRFVISVAKQYQNRGLPLTDLISEGNIGLMKAAQNFDETKGFKFISYAVWWIRQMIIQAVNTKSRLVRLPENKVALRNRIQCSISLLEQELERSPSAEEIAQQVHLGEKDIDEITSSAICHQSLDAPLNGENTESTLLDSLCSFEYKPDDKMAHTTSLQQEIDRCLTTLTPIQSTIIRCFYGIGLKEMRIEDIGLKLKLSTERVRQIKQKAIRQLQTGKKAGLLKPFLG